MRSHGFFVSEKRKLAKFRLEKRFPEEEKSLTDENNLENFLNCFHMDFKFEKRDSNHIFGGMPRKASRYLESGQCCCVCTCFLLLLEAIVSLHYQCMLVNWRFRKLSCCIDRFTLAALSALIPHITSHLCFCLPGLHCRCQGIPNLRHYRFTQKIDGI